MSTIISVLRETEVILPAGSKWPVREALGKALRRERLAPSGTHYKAPEGEGCFYAGSGWSPM
jgi:hypothetical protein